MPWTRVCTADSIDAGEAMVIMVEPSIALFNCDGEFYAVDDTCPHGQSSLADGYVEGCAVECILHYSRFDLRTGRALGLPATTHLRTYAVKIEDDSVYVDLDGRTPQV